MTDNQATDQLASDQRNRPIIILIRGLPGSGKTHLAFALRESLEADGGEVVMLDPDATDYNSQAYADHIKQQIAEGVDPKLHAYRFLRGQAYEGIATHKIVLWNQPFTNLEIFDKMVARFNEQADEHNVDLPILVVEVMINHEVAAKRVLERKQAGGHGPSENTFNRFTNDFHSFAENGYTTVAVAGDDDVDKSIAKVRLALHELLSK